MTDLLEGAEPPITITDQIKCVEREIGMRKKVYRRRVEVGAMGQAEADREIAVMETVLTTLEFIERARV